MGHGTPDILAIKPLVKALTDNNAQRRKNAAEVLSGLEYKLEWKPDNQREEINYLIAKEFFYGVVKFGRPAAEVLIKLKVPYDSEKKVKEALISIGKDGVCVEGVTFMADNRKKQPSTELTITDGMWEEKSSFEDAPW